MATATPVLRSLRSTASQQRTRLGWRDNFITILLGLWLMVGLFVDGWAHNNLAQLESFFTPWHALFYSGFMANAAWSAWLVYREWRPRNVRLHGSDARLPCHKVVSYLWMEAPGDLLQAGKAPRSPVSASRG